jgi:DNA (cytosine-5)-methyltransferase 3A
MRILSLFDGMSCGVLAMMESGVPIDRYVAYEIDKYAIQTSTHNFPFIEQRGDVFKADFTEFEGFDWLIGGSPCTYWSIAQTNNRETTASGMGWELFQQYVRALHEAKPKYFIYENNKSMSKDIRQSIDEAFGFEAVLINSALLSAQNRQRLYWVGRRNDDGTYSKVDVPQPQDRGILLKDVLETGCDLTTNDKSYVLTASYNGAVPWNTIERSQRNMVCEPVIIGYPRGNNEGGAKYDKSPTLTASSQMACGGGLGGKTGLYAVPVNTTIDGKAVTLKSQYYKNGMANLLNDTSKGGKYSASGVAEPVCKTIERAIPDIVDKYGHLPEMFNAYNRAEIIDKAPTLSTGSMVTSSCAVNRCENICCFAVPVEWDEEGRPTKARSCADGKIYTVYEVKDGEITIKDKKYPIKLPDGFYIIRKLTVRECMRLQTVPEWYEFPVSDSQAYKMLGNGWTVLVISWLIDCTLR